mmetsp:Transcript_8010/g.21337  ORF Transcript_8010/g.21337 Transcript_8010/m.21337 type:complete len:222 (-) Transcript_8010:12-677(-)
MVSGQSCFSLRTTWSDLPSAIVMADMKAAMKVGANTHWSSKRLRSVPLSPGAVTMLPSFPYHVAKIGPTKNRPSNVKLRQRLASKACCSTHSCEKMSPAPFSTPHVTARVSIGCVSSSSRYLAHKPLDPPPPAPSPPEPPDATRMEPPPRPPPFPPGMLPPPVRLLVNPSLPTSFVCGLGAPGMKARKPVCGACLTASPLKPWGSCCQILDCIFQIKAFLT